MNTKSIIAIMIGIGLIFIGFISVQYMNQKAKNMGVDSCINLAMIQTQYSEEGKISTVNEIVTETFNLCMQSKGYK